MPVKTLFAGMLLLAGRGLLAQSSLPIIIKASSQMVDIRDGNLFKKASWRISPEAKPDVYTTSSKNKRVSFITDIDSISFVVKPEKIYDFIILLNNKDTAYTRVIFKPSHLDVLKNAKDYNANDQRAVPAFTYQPANNANLQVLRNTWKLDSIAGSGNEASKIINLLHWVHNFIPHDGNHENPVIKNAMSMIAECKKGDRGLNCRGLATVLNECYLSMGIPSRFVTCMPKDSVFDDCHVINLVYSRELKKWLWIDPTNDAYVMDEKGELLDIREVRERLINGKTLIVNPDANWNHKTSAIKQEYLYHYMAKNLYRFECPLTSEYDVETRAKGKSIPYLELLPLDGYKQLPQLKEYTNAKTGVTFINYKTNNPDIFWAVP